MGLFSLIPLLIIVVYSLLKAGSLGGVEWSFSLEAYQQLLFEEDFDGTISLNWGYIGIFLRSFKLAGLCTVISAAIGFPMAYYMATRSSRQRALWIFLVTIPFWTNLLIRTYAWILLLRSEGLINNLLLWFGVIRTPLQLLYGDFAVGIGLLNASLPFMVLPIFANLERMDWRLIEAAEDLYAPRWKVLWHVVLPLARPGILAGSVLVFIPSIGAFLAPDLLGGEKQLMLGNLVQLQFGLARNWPLGAALSVVLMLIVALSFLILRRIHARKAE
jgi:spermidine/putrescine transport system permease protein